MRKGEDIPVRERFEQAVADEIFDDQTARLFQQWLQEVREHDGLSAARTVFMEYVQRADSLAEAGYPVILSGYGDTNTLPAFIAWSDALLAMPLPQLLQNQVYGNQLVGMLMLGQDELAKQKLLHGLSQGLTSASNNFGVITRRFMQSGKIDAAISWTEELLQGGVASNLQARALGWQVGAFLQLENTEKVLEKIPQCLSLMQEGDALRLFNGILLKWSQNKDLDAIGRALAVIRDKAGDRPAFNGFVFVEEFKMLLLQNRWEEAAASFKAVAAQLPEEARWTTYRYLDMEGKRAKIWDKLDGLYDFVLTRFPEENALADSAAVGWVACARELGTISELPDRITRMLRLGLRSGLVVNAYKDSIYAVIAAEQNDTLKAMLAVGDAIAKTSLSVKERIELTPLMFDAAFVLEDYERVLTAIAAGVGDKSEDWHQMAKNKVLAHKAMKEKNYKEAALRFGDFMTFVNRMWERPEMDPSTGVLHTREMALGFNAKRIAEIHVLAGDTNAAAEAHADAMDYYRQALTALDPESKEAALVNAEIQQLEAGGVSDGK